MRNQTAKAAWFLPPSHHPHYPWHQVAALQNAKHSAEAQAQDQRQELVLQVCVLPPELMQLPSLPLLPLS